jgi:isoleucyl-tRNA synthetase
MEAMGHTLYPLKSNNSPVLVTISVLIIALFDRLYLINSPVVRAETLRFQESGVKDVVKDVFLPWYNAYRFLMQNINRLQRENGVEFHYSEELEKLSQNFMDRWILSFTQSLVKFIHKEMAAYRLYTVIPRLVKFIDMLTNWYVRSNRKRLKGEGGTQDCLDALSTLFDVLYTMVRFMAPFTPFLTEMLYQELKAFIKQSTSKNQNTDSVHYLMVSNPRDALIDGGIERAVQRMQTVIELGRVIRDRKTLPIKFPLHEVVVINPDPQCLQDIQSLEGYIKEELNVKVVTTAKDRERYGVGLRAEPDHQELGRRLKSDFKSVTAAVRELRDEQLKQYQESGKIEVLGHTLLANDLRISYHFSGEKSSRYEAHADNDILVLLDVTPDQSMLDEGVAREVVNKIQKLRKKGKLQPSDPVTIVYRVSAIHDEKTDGQDRLLGIMTNYADYIEAALKQPIRHETSDESQGLIIEEEAPMKGVAGALLCAKIYPRLPATSSASASVSLSEAESATEQPFCQYCRVVCQTPDAFTFGTVLLENPVGENKLDFKSFKHEIEILFGLRGRKFHLTSKVVPNVVKNTFDAYKLNRQTVTVNLPMVVQDGQVLPSPLMSFINIKSSEQVKATFLLRNPMSSSPISKLILKQLVQKVFGSNTRQLKWSVQGLEEGHLSNEDIKLALEVS